VEVGLPPLPNLTLSLLPRAHKHHGYTQHTAPPYLSRCARPLKEINQPLSLPPEVLSPDKVLSLPRSYLHTARLSHPLACHMIYDVSSSDAQQDALHNPHLDVLRNTDPVLYQHGDGRPLHYTPC
jgi:hypothetical protein